MGIQVKDNLNKYIFVAVAVLLNCSLTVFASTPQQVLLKSYEINFQKNSLEETTKLIAELESACDDCKDKYLASRIVYRIGILNFHTGAYIRAYDIFSEVATEATDFETQISALNMKANCARFSGKAKEAILSFQEVLQEIEKRGSVSGFQAKLVVSGYYSIAQLYAQTGDIAGAIRTYSDFVKKYAKSDDMNDFVFKAKESKAHLILESGDRDGYLICLKEIIASDVSEGSKGLLELQQVCMEFILKYNKADEVTSVAKIPVHAVSIVANDTTCNVSELLSLVAGLRNKYNNTESSVYINYVYAWLLDASGDKQKSLDIFGNIIDACSEVGSKDRYFYLGEYAKVQSAILSGELNDYNTAIKMIDRIEAKNSEHLLKISGSVKKSLTTLKREVPKDDKK